MNLFSCARDMNWETAKRCDPREKWNKFHLSQDEYNPESHDQQSCSICKIAKWTPIGKKDILRKGKPWLVSDGIAEPSIPKKLPPKKICIKCKKETGCGIPHHCTPTAAKRNIAEMITFESTSSQEQILSQGLKKILNEKGKDRKEEIRLTGMQGGNPLSVTVGKSQEKPHPELITPEFMVKLQKKIG